MRQVRAMRNADYSVELDWSYLDIIYDDNDGRETFPRFLLAVEPKNEFILVNEMLSPSHNQSGVIFNVLDHLVERYGKPAEIIICDDDLHSILADACSKVKIKLTKKKKLPAVQKARKAIISR